MNETMPCFEAHSLSFKFGQKPILQSVSLTVQPGEVVGLLGPNGAGKTTLFRILCGQYRAKLGQVRLGGTDVSKWPLWRRVRLGLAYVPQESTILRGLTVEENIHIGLSQGSAKERRSAIEDALSHFGLLQLRHAKGSQLSGGEARRLELARAFSTRPRMMLVDEPFAALDPLASEEVGRFLREFAAQGTGILLSDHDVAQSLSLCDRIYILFEGQIIFAGSPEQVAQNARVRDTYLGERLSKAWQ